MGLGHGVIHYYIRMSVSIRKLEVSWRVLKLSNTDITTIKAFG